MADVKRSIKIIDLSSQKFGRLTVVGFHGVVNRRAKWNCVCECGTETVVDSGNLRSGHTNSCGCLVKDALSLSKVTHGYARKGNVHPIWNVWYAMKQRCYFPKNCSYQFYGQRGITVCEEWMDSGVFIEWALNNGWQEGMQIDRIDVDGNYCPENCRFVTPTENSRNRTNNSMVFYKDKWITIAELSELSGIDRCKLAYRLKHGWTIDEALNPKRIRHYHKMPNNVSSSIVNKRDM